MTKKMNGAMVMVNAFLTIIKNQYANVMTSGKVQLVLAAQIKSLVKIKEVNWFV